MSADVARGHGGDGGGDDHPPPHEIAGDCRELRDSRVPVSNPDLLRYKYCWQRILAGRGSTFICTYTNDQIMAMVREGKQRGHIPGVGRVLAGRGKDVLDVPMPRCNHTSDVNELKRSKSSSRSRLTCGSGAAGDDESGDDEDADEDAEDADS
ncbi:hypothetical protein Tco_0449027 [Tanacetum coccineum]